MKSRKFSSEMIVSISAVVIAVVSIAVTIWQGIETREHNRLSVQPRLDISYSLDYNNNLAQLTLKNKGLGPAVIGEAVATVDVSNYRLNDQKQFAQFLTELRIGNLTLTFDALEFGSTLMPKEQLAVFSIGINLLEDNDINPLSILNKVKLKISYKSLYEEEYFVEQ